MLEPHDDLELEIGPVELRDVEPRPRPAEPGCVVEVMGSPQGALPVYLDAEAIARLLHAQPEHRRIETGGLLVGGHHRDEAGEYVLVSSAIPAELAAGRPLSLTFTHESWAGMLQAIDQRHPHEQVVGWYHTHPGLGVFLSTQDQFIHSSFFGAPEQIALVVDTHSFTWGIFTWESGELRETRGFYVFSDDSADQDEVEAVLRRYSHRP